LIVITVPLCILDFKAGDFDGKIAGLPDPARGAPNVGGVTMRHTMRAASAAACAMALAGAGSARAADTLSWSFAGATVGFCNFTQCGTQPLQIAGHQDGSGSDFNASALTLTPHGNAAAWAAPGAAGLLPDLHAIAVAFGPNQTPGQANISWAVVEAVQVYQWTGGAYDLDPTMFVGSVDYSASNVPGPASGIIAGFAILDSSILAANSLGNPWFNFGMSGSALTGAFQGDCSTPGAVGIADGGYDHMKGNQSYSIGATACNGLLHLNSGDEFVLWSKMYVNENAPGVLDASHTFHIGLDPNVPPSTAQTLVSNVQLQSYSYSVPEPAAWALMLLGFGGVGAALRRRRVALV
jgi:hypothetical protein